MNTILRTLLTTAASLAAITTLAQNAGTPPEGGPGRRPMNPVINALDANHDGVLDAAEIANAANALKSLDQNGDGQITRDEIHAGRPEGGRGPGGPGGPEGSEGRGRRGPGGRPGAEGRPSRPAPAE